MTEIQAVWQEIKTEANRLGFNHIGAAPALPLGHFKAFQEWVHAGRHAGMSYLARGDTLRKRQDPREILETCRSIICLAMPYAQPEADLETSQPGCGRISSYARTVDYHQVIWEKLAQLEDAIRAACGGSVHLKSYVDTGPVLERSYAMQAGLGTAGKHTCLLIQGTGSYFFLAEILTDLDLPLDEPFTRDLCGTCQRCIEACPTGCIRADRTLEAARCISYLTIENKGIIPGDLKEEIGSWVFGCDVCQVVCPHNASTPEQRLPLGEPLIPEFIDLITLLQMDEETFSRRFGHTPLARASRHGMIRNAAVVLGNQRCSEALSALKVALVHEKNPAVQDACRWAIAQIARSEGNP